MNDNLTFGDVLYFFIIIGSLIALFITGHWLIGFVFLTLIITEVI